LYWGGEPRAKEGREEKTFEQGRLKTGTHLRLVKITVKSKWNTSIPNEGENGRKMTAGWQATGRTATAIIRSRRTSNDLFVTARKKKRREKRPEKG